MVSVMAKDAGENKDIARHEDGGCESARSGLSTSGRAEMDGITQPRDYDCVGREAGAEVSSNKSSRVIDNHPSLVELAKVNQRQDADPPCPVHLKGSAGPANYISLAYFHPIG